MSLSLYICIHHKKHIESDESIGLCCLVMADTCIEESTRFFCIYFTYELVTRLAAFERKRDCWKDGWFKTTYMNIHR